MISCVSLAACQFVSELTEVMIAKTLLAQDHSALVKVEICACLESWND